MALWHRAGKNHSGQGQGCSNYLTMYQEQSFHPQNNPVKQVLVQSHFTDGKTEVKWPIQGHTAKRLQSPGRAN